MTAGTGNNAESATSHFLKALVADGHPTWIALILGSFLAMAIGGGVNATVFKPNRVKELEEKNSTLQKDLVAYEKQIAAIESLSMPDAVMASGDSLKPFGWGNSLPREIVQELSQRDVELKNILSVSMEEESGKSVIEISVQSDPTQGVTGVVEFDYRCVSGTYAPEEANLCSAWQLVEIEKQITYGQIPGQLKAQVKQEDNCPYAWATHFIEKSTVFPATPDGNPVNYELQCFAPIAKDSWDWEFRDRTIPGQPLKLSGNDSSS